MTDPPNREVVVFSAARRLPLELRASYLDEVCSGDAALRQRMAELLEAIDEADGFLQAPAPGAPRTPNPQDPAGSRSTIQVVVPSEKIGDRIGRYKLLQQIGEGGCGVVYMAEQEKPVRRRVALKVIKLGMDTRSVIARFEAERQALALMDHPNIAKVLDAGGTGAGRPFFVMELVRGIKVTDYCDQNNLSTTERLGLFIQICQAIQHAHQKGIIHRDIKPSNILVTMHDGQPVPKVIDFGIAKATDQRLTDKTLFTAFEQIIGTPAYMSPEQAEMSALDIDTRTDIYSLGVLLYELLTSQTPFDSAQLIRAGLDQMRRTIREQEPVRPSTRLSTMLNADLTRVARQRHAEPARLSNLIRGDLDWVVMKCLEKDRTRRYETANGLAMDIKRHLQHEPVVARPPSKLYRFQKLARRNQGIFAAGAAVLATLVLGLGISTYLFVQEKRANQRALEAKAFAQSQEKKSQQVAGFLREMLKGVGPEAELGADTKLLRNILEQTTARADKDLKDQPEVKAEVLQTLGGIYYDLGEYARAEQIQREALALNKQIFGGTGTNVATSLHELATTLWDRSKLAEAEATFRVALDLRKRLLGENDSTVAETLNDLGLVMWTRGDLAESELLIRQALEIRKKLLRPADPHLAEAYGDLGLVLWEHGEFADAEVNIRTSLALRQGNHGDHRSIEASARNNLGNVLLSQGKMAEAEASYVLALDLLQVLPEDHPHRLLVRSHLGTAVRRRAALTGDATLFRTALQLDPLSQLTADALATALAKPFLTPVPSDSPVPTSNAWFTCWTTNLTGPAPGFPSETWQSNLTVCGRSGYSPRTDRSVAIRTNLWFRREFNLTEVPKGKLTLLLGRNHDAQVFLNGIPAAPAADWSDTEVLLPCSDSGQAALKLGSNVLAVHCQDIDGGARIEVGLFTTSDPTLGRNQLIDEFTSMIATNDAQRAELCVARANAFARLGRWQEAAADLTRSLERKPSTANSCKLAVLLLVTRDEASYRLRRQAVLDRFAHTDSFTMADQVCKMALLIPADGSELEPVLRLTENLADPGNAYSSLAWRQLAKALAEYRADRFPQAIDWTSQTILTGSRRDLPGWTEERERNRAAAAYLVQAMARHRSEGVAPARLALTKANHLIQEQLPHLDSGDFGREWQDRLIVQILLSEATKLMEGTTGN
jgi:serine/threonine protein kinase